MTQQTAETTKQTKLDQCITNIRRELRSIFKNAPVSSRNASKHRSVALDLREAADIIDRRVKNKLHEKALRARSDVKRS